MDIKKAHYMVVTGIVINKQGKYLIAKRSDNEKVFPGKWTVPGGKIEQKDYASRPKDTPHHWYNIFENALRREVLEEVGLKIKGINYLTSLSFERPDGVPTIVVSLYGEHDGDDEVKLCEDLTEHAWVSLEEAKNYDLIHGIYDELEMLDKKLKGEDVGEWGK